MPGKTTIQWTDKTWNPITGCQEVSPGCDRCYARTFAERFRDVPGHPFEQGFDLKLWPERVDLPLAWKKPHKIFVNSMSDLFHKDVPDDFILTVFNTMITADHHIYQVLTKRPSRLVNTRLVGKILSNIAALTGKTRSEIHWPEHIWLGVSVENQEYAWRIDALRKVPVPVRFISYEPALGRLSAELTGISWLIAGGESGSGARPINPDWFREVRDHCGASDTAFFVKQMGSHWMHEYYPADYRKDTHGGNMQYFPGDLRIREYPKVESPIVVGGKS